MNELQPYIAQLLDSVISGFRYFLPEICLTAAFLISIFVELFIPGKKSRITFSVSLAGVILSMIIGFIQNIDVSRISLFGDTLVLDTVSISFKYIFGFATVLSLIFIRYNRSLQEHVKGVGDLYLIVPATLIGLNLMSMASSLLMIYISVEMVSLASYLMVGYAASSNKQTEAAMKYVLFGSVCSAIMLYGISLLYGFTGTLNIISQNFLANLSQIHKPGIMLSTTLVLIGIGFKLSFVPLHFWSPDVYEGAPTPVTAFLSTAPKIAGFALLIRFLEPFDAYEHQSGAVLLDFRSIISMVAIATMILGNFSAIWQNSVKRMLAYSSIGHTGFALMAIVAFEGSGFKSLIFYFAVYTLMNIAAFILADRVEEYTGATDLRGYKGLGKLLKLEMVCFVIVLIALTGLPPTGGFIAKLFVFSSAFEHYSTTKSALTMALLATGAVTTVVSLFYYLKVPLYAYLRAAEPDAQASPNPNLLTYLIALIAFLLIVFGIFPDFLSL